MLMASSPHVDSEIARAGADVDKPALSLLQDHGVGSSTDESLDDNYGVFKGAAVEYDEAEERRVLSKIDLRVMPVLFVTYFLQYLDKSEPPPPRQTTTRAMLVSVTKRESRGQT